MQVDRNGCRLRRPFGTPRGLNLGDCHVLGGAQICSDKDQRENLQADASQELSAAANEVYNDQGKGSVLANLAIP
jgi:hypothetical protein